MHNYNRQKYFKKNNLKSKKTFNKKEIYFHYFKASEKTKNQKSIDQILKILLQKIFLEMTVLYLLAEVLQVMLVVLLQVFSNEE